MLAADSAATYGNLGRSTIVQTSATKLTPIAGTLIVGMSGPVGFSQRYVETVDGLWRSNQFASLAPAAAMVLLANHLKALIGSEVQLMVEFAKVLGPAAASSVMCSTLVAMPIADEARLFQFDHQGSPEEATESLPFVAIGSGEPIADPFLAFLRRVFWPTGLPTVSDGTLTAVWTLDHAIRTNPGGVGGQIHVLILETANGGWGVRELEDSQVQEHTQMIQLAEDRLRTFRDVLIPGSNEEPVPMPPPA